MIPERKREITMSDVVVIVDDNIEFVRCCFRKLRNQNYIPLVARTPADIFYMLEHGVVDVCVLRQQTSPSLLIAVLTALGEFRSETKLLLLTSRSATPTRSRRSRSGIALWSSYH